MQTAASHGRKLVIDRDGVIVWAEGDGPVTGHAPPPLAPGSRIITGHEPMTAGRDWAVGDTYSVVSE
jgi:hypothetical protein